MKFLAFSFTVIVSAVLAAPVEYFFDITQPQDNKVYHVGDSVPLEWQHGTGGKATVTVLKGTDPAEMLETSYQFEVDGNSRSASWKIPPGLSTSEKYNFQIAYASGPNQKEGKSYSKQFSISNEAPMQQGTSTQQGTSSQQGAPAQQVGANQPGTMAASSNGDNGSGKKSKNNGGGNSTMMGGSMPQQIQGNQVAPNNNGMNAGQGRASAQQAGGVSPMQSGNKMAMVNNGQVTSQSMGQTGQLRQGGI